MSKKSVKDFFDKLKQTALPFRQRCLLDLHPLKFRPKVQGRGVLGVGGHEGVVVVDLFLTHGVKAHDRLASRLTGMPGRNLGIVRIAGVGKGRRKPGDQGVTRCSGKNIPPGGFRFLNTSGMLNSDQMLE